MQKKVASPISYKESGVDLAKASSLAQHIGKLAAKINSTKQDNLLQGIGGFASLYELPKSFRQPVLATATDGVGSKLELAQDEEDYHCLGIDLVAMCVNDLLCCGASPYLFLDYYATGSLDEEQATAVISGMCEGCRQADCLLVGGETAEMPGLYDVGKFDLAGFAVGIVEKDQIISPTSINDKAKQYMGDMNDGDAGGINIIGIRSNGVHANGFSLVRKLLDAGRLDLPVKLLMRPTKIYVQQLEELAGKIDIVAIAHITGGGVTDNLPRVLPQGFSAEIKKEAVLGWLDSSDDERAKIFQQLRVASGSSDEEMLQTFNCGIGMAILHPAEQTDKLVQLLSEQDEEALLIGSLTPQSSQQQDKIVYV